MDYYKAFAIAALMRSPLTKMQVMMIAKNIFSWPLSEAREKFDEIEKRHYLADSGTLCYRQGDAVYARTGDRTEYLSEEFLGRCSEEQAKALRKAKLVLLARE